MVCAPGCQTIAYFQEVDENELFAASGTGALYRRTGRSDGVAVYNGLRNGQVFRAENGSIRTFEPRFLVYRGVSPEGVIH